MQKILSVLLILGMMFSLSTHTFAEEQENGPEAIAADPTGAILAPGISPMEIGFLDMDLTEVQTSSKRNTEQENNLIFPGPFTIQSAYPSTGKSSIHLAAYRVNWKKQYFCMMIYKGDDLTGEPVATDTCPFTMPLGYDTPRLYWEKRNADPGMYTLVLFTGVESDGYIVPVEDTASMTEIYVYNTAVPTATEFYITDFETGEQVDTITLPYGYSTVLEVNRSPLPSDGSIYATLHSPDNTSTASLDLVEAEYAAGYLILTPKTYGIETVVLKCGSYTREYTLEVCAYADGHHYEAPIPAGTSTAQFRGCTLYCCDGCGYVKREYTPSYAEVFQGFRDVPKESWYASSVEECVLKNLFQGVAADRFAPDTAMTRAMLVTVLWRYEGEPMATASEFVDVSSRDWFAQAVNWAAEEEIVNGVGKSRFNPHGTITREQLATILYRYAMRKGLNTQISVAPDTYPDGGQVSSWAREAISWALGYELINGVQSGSTVTLAPLGQATRAQVSAILIRFIQKSNEEAFVLPNLGSALYHGTLHESEGVELTWALYESGLLQIGGTVPENWTCDQWTMPWYAYREQIKAVEFLPGIESVWTSAFNSYPNLQMIKLAHTVRTVGATAFYKCAMLKEVELSEGLESIGRAAFQSCTALETVVLPESLLKIDTSGFAGCMALKDTELPGNLKHIGDGAFKLCHSLEMMIIPDSVQEMGSGTFADCTSLKQVKLSYSVIRLSETFVNCSSLVDVILPVGLESMGTGTFYKCTSLEALIFPTTFRSMNSGNFSDCTSLRALYFLGNRLGLSDQVDRDLPYHSCEPFGPYNQVIVYGFTGSGYEQYAELYGYPFVDILSILE